MIAGRPSIAAGMLLALAVLLPAAAGADDTGLPSPLGNLAFGMPLAQAHDVLPEARQLEPGVDFGRLKGRLVLPKFPTLGSVFRIYLQFDGSDALRQILLERRHAAATRASAREIQTALTERYGNPAEICMPTEAQPAQGRLTWTTGHWTLHLIGINDLGAGILTEDADRANPLETKPIARSRDERQRGSQQRSLPRRLLVRVHASEDTSLLPPPCEAGLR